VPLPTDTTKQNGTTIHEFNTESILGKSVWHQIGDSQIYKFKITQPTIKTDEFTPEQLSFLSQNKYTMILPRKYDETNQEILFTNIDPQPETLKKDRNGNLVASFLVDATKKEEILIEGFITVELEESGNRHSLPESVDIARLDQFGDMEKYLQSSEFWQVDAPEIQAKAKELAGDSENIMEILEADYKFIVDSIDYDDFKYGDRNKRQGALKTLGGGDSVCMEYSDLLITLLRAQGIPARAAYGYGYDPQFAPDNQESHQWVQAWVPDYGWLTIDPTWGETGRDFIGKDLDHALWYVASEHPDNPAPLEVTSSFSDFTVEQSQIEIVAVEKLPEDIDYKSIAQLQQDIPLQQAKVEEISEKIRVSPVGKSFIIIIPSCLGVLILIVFLSSVVKFLKGKNRASKAGKQSNYPGQPSQ
jgi:transglutaminase-like putative cysteine protease